MTGPVRWGVLSTAAIGDDVVEQVIVDPDGALGLWRTSSERAQPCPT